MAEKEKFTTTLDGELLRRVKILAVNRRCSANVLIEEAMEELLKKYGDEGYQGKYPLEEKIPAVHVIHESQAKYGKKAKK